MLMRINSLQIQPAAVMPKQLARNQVKRLNRFGGSTQFKLTLEDAGGHSRFSG